LRPEVQSVKAEKQNMELIINNHRYSVSQPPLGRGGEGEIYPLNNDYVVKVYHSDVLNDERRQKVLSLCNAYQSNMAQLGGDSFAFPQYEAYENQATFQSIVGFSMSYFKNCFPLPDIKYDLNTEQFRTAGGNKFNDQQAIEFIYQMFERLELLHKSRIVLGDVNQNNILCDFSESKPKPIFIDLDSAQFGQFYCAPAFSEDYIDPLVVQQGKNPNGSYMYSSESDVFSISCIAYYFFCGYHPFYLRSHPPSDIVENKQKGISMIRCCRGDGVNYLYSLGIEYLPKLNEKVEKRIENLSALDKTLADFFISVFVRNERDNLVYSLPMNDARNPRFTFFRESGFGDVIEREKKKREMAKLENLQKTSKKQAHHSDRMGINDILSKMSGRKGTQPKKQFYHDPRELTLFLNHYYGPDLKKIFQSV
jgi:serine/threonine protein kinase